VSRYTRTDYEALPPSKCHISQCREGNLRVAAIVVVTHREHMSNDVVLEGDFLHSVTQPTALSIKILVIVELLLQNFS